MGRRLGFALGALFALAFLAVAYVTAGLFLAHRQIRNLEPELPPADAILALWRDPALVERVTGHARMLVAGRFSWAILATPLRAAIAALGLPGAIQYKGVSTDFASCSPWHSSRSRAPWV